MENILSVLDKPLCVEFHRLRPWSFKWSIHKEDAAADSHCSSNWQSAVHAQSLSQLHVYSGLQCQKCMVEERSPRTNRTTYRCHSRISHSPILLCTTRTHSTPQRDPKIRLPTNILIGLFLLDIADREESGARRLEDRMKLSRF